MAAAAAGIAAAAIGAAGAIGGSVISSRGAANAAQIAGRGIGTKVPLPGYASAINHEVARGLAENMNAVPPSLDQYVKSGGTALFPWTNPGITPVEGVKLGIFDKKGNAVPQ